MKIPWNATFKFRILLLGMTGWITLFAIILFLGVFSRNLKNDFDRSLEEIQEREGRLLQEQQHAVVHRQMRQKTLDVARELSLFIKVHHTRPWKELRLHAEFRQTAVQPLGTWGETFLLTPEGQKILVHAQPGQENRDLAPLASCTRLFQILEEYSRTQRWSVNYYEGEGDCHAFFVPVEARPLGGPALMVGAVADPEQVERSINSPRTVLKTSINLSRALIEASLRHFRKEVFIFLGGLGLLGLLASLALVREQTREIDSLTLAAEAYNAGNLEHRTPPLGHSELGQLAQTLNRMAGSLQENTVSREEWENTFNIIPDQIMVLDAQQRILRVNRATAEYLGLPPAEILGRPCYELMHGSQSPPLFCPFHQALDQGCGVQGEFHTEDGDCTFLITVTPLGESHNGNRGAVHVARDITGFKQIQRELGQTSHFLNQIIESAPIAVAVVDRRGIFTQVNPQFFKEYGYEPEDILGQPYSRLYASRVEMCRVLTELRDYGELLNYRASFRHKNGRIIPTRISVRNLWDTDGKLLGSVALGSNISEEINLQRQMEQVQKLEAVATLSGGLAHNFNNLLSIIMGLTDLMLSNIGPEHEFYDDLKEIKLQVRAGRELTQNLLAFARGTRFEMQPLSLNDLVRATADMFARTRRDIQIVPELAADLPLVEVDSSQIQQVLMNFLINAWQAMPGGGQIRLQTRTVNVRQWHDPAWDLHIPGFYAVLSVSDRGVGMDKETLSHIFEPFFTTKPPDQGTGLGLSSAYRIIKSHRGAIQVKSRKSRGTTFSILLPVSHSQPVALPGEETRLMYGRGTILVVDDEPVLRRVATRLLEKLGYRVLSVDSGESAVELFQERHQEIDLVLLDVVMPGLNGFQTLKRLRALQPGVRVLLCSGYGDGKGGKLPEDVGFLAKPYTLKFLSQKVAAVMRA